jgi:hypothetical protein
MKTLNTWRYSCQYRRDNAPLSRIYRLSVTAVDANDARRKLAEVDPHFLATVRSPQRRAAVTVMETPA